MKWLRRLFAALALAFMVIALVRGWPEAQLLLHVDLTRVLVAGGLSIASVAALAVSWSTLVTPAASGSVGAVVEFLLSMPARYLPGGVFQHVGLAERRVRGGMTSGDAVALVILHSTVIGVAAVALAAVAVVGSPAIELPQVMVVGLAAPAVLTNRAERAIRAFIDRRWSSRLASVRLPTAPQRYRALVWSSASIILSAGSFAALAAGTAGTSFVSAAGGFEIGFLAGFVAVPVPAGLAIREATIAGVLPGLELATAVALSSAHRLLAIVAELATVAVAAATLAGFSLRCR